MNYLQIMGLVWIVASCTFLLGCWYSSRGVKDREDHAKVLVENAMCQMYEVLGQCFSEEDDPEIRKWIFEKRDEINLRLEK